MAMLAIATLTQFGCQTGIKTEAVRDNLVPVMDRHDAYAATALVGRALEEARADTTAIRAAMQLNVDGHLPENIDGHVVPVLDRHDNWVANDRDLPELSRDVYLDSSRALRMLFQPK
jgi:hypothetical protein